MTIKGLLKYWVLQLLIIGMGLSFITSITGKYYYGGSAFHRNAVIIAIALIGQFILSRFKYQRFRDYNKMLKWIFFLLFIINLLVFSNYFGLSRGSSKSWIRIFGFSIQPVEFLKFFSIIYISFLIDKKKGLKGKSLSQLYPILTIAGLSLLIPVLQRDFGTFFGNVCYLWIDFICCRIK